MDSTEYRRPPVRPTFKRKLDLNSRMFSRMKSSLREIERGIVVSKPPEVAGNPDDSGIEANNDESGDTDRNGGEVPKNAETPVVQESEALSDLSTIVEPPELPQTVIDASMPIEAQQVVDTSHPEPGEVIETSKSLESLDISKPNGVDANPDCSPRVSTNRASAAPAENGLIVKRVTLQDSLHDESGDTHRDGGEVSKIAETPAVQESEALNDLSTIVELSELPQRDIDASTPIEAQKVVETSNPEPGEVIEASKSLESLDISKPHEGDTKAECSTSVPTKPSPAAPAENGLIVRRMFPLLGPGRAFFVQRTPLFTYPARAANFGFVVLVDAFGPATPENVRESLQKKKIIGSERCGNGEVFLVKEAQPGTYGLSTNKGLVHVYICAYEPEQAGFRGCFAAGYSYFTRELRQCAPSVLLGRGYLDIRGSKGIYEKRPFAISRSYGTFFERRTKPEVFDGDFIGADTSTLGDNAIKASREAANARIADKMPGSSRTSRGSLAKIIQSRVPSKCEKCDLKISNNLSMDTILALGILSSPERMRHLREVRGPCDGCLRKLSNEVDQMIAFLKRSQSKPPPTARAGEADISKYYWQRFTLISKYNAGLNLSDQAWFSICPEMIAKHIATRIVQLSKDLERKIVVADPFCGSGGNIVHLAALPQVEKAYAFDIDPAEVECARRMAKLYRVEDKLAFGKCDIFDLSFGDGVTIDAMVFSPPWGGPTYLNAGFYDISKMPVDYREVLKVCRKFTKNLAVLLPRNTCVDQIVLSDPAEKQEFGSWEPVELELNFLNDKPKTSTAYYGELVNNTR